MFATTVGLLLSGSLCWPHYDMEGNAHQHTEQKRQINELYLQVLHHSWIGWLAAQYPPLLVDSPFVSKRPQVAQSRTGDQLKSASMQAATIPLSPSGAVACSFNWDVLLYLWR
jgi:hypothetical protein